MWATTREVMSPSSARYWIPTPSPSHSSLAARRTKPSATTRIASRRPVPYRRSWIWNFPRPFASLATDSSSLLTTPSLPVAAIVWFCLVRFLTRKFRRRARVLRRPFPEAWEKILRERVTYYAALDDDERAAGYIASREYRYHLPVGFVRKSDKRFVELAHVALTNEPATIN